MNTQDRKGSIAILVPAFREGKYIAEVVAACLRHGRDVVVIDDGSPDDTAANAEKAGAIVLRHPVNQGKGAALQTGFQYAMARGYEAVITLDGDGQHDPAEIPDFIACFEKSKPAMVVGSRMSDVSTMPWIRKCTNWFMSWLLSRLMKQWVPDTQCGYRLLRCDILPLVKVDAKRFAAESEILLEIAGQGHRIESVPIKTIYRDEKSKINPMVDTWRFFSMLRQYRKTHPGPAPRAPVQ